MLSVPSAALRASISSHTPILFDATTNEPFLAFDCPTSQSPLLASLRLTPPRLSDAAALTATLNDPRVYPHLRSPPYPYPTSHADAVIQAGLDAAQCLVDRWAHGDWSATDVCPLSTVRGTLEDGEQVWVGAVGVRRWPFDELEGESKARKVREMVERPPGDPGILWTMGFYLDPRFHHQGIATRVVRVLIDSFMIPVLNAHTIRATVYVGNWGSRRALEKNGFVLAGSAWINAGVSRGGMTKEEWWFVWKRNRSVASGA